MRCLDEAARALARAGGQDWDVLPTSDRETILSSLRVVLDALREPDDGMVDAGAEIIRHVCQGESDTAYRNDATNAWRYMIDAVQGRLR